MGFNNELTLHWVYAWLFHATMQPPGKESGLSFKNKVALMFRRSTLAVSLMLLMAIAWGAPASVQVPALDLQALLPPPPAQDSVQTKDEIKELLQIQKKRTKEQADFASGDVEKSVFRFSDVMGDKFTPDHLPLTAALFEKVLSTAKSAVKPVKVFYNRPRPYTADKAVHPCIKEEDTGEAYPSGHATAGVAMSVVLASMVPEKKAEIFARGRAFAYNRMMAGVHYRSDMEAGILAGTLVAESLLEDAAFMRDFSKAKNELRSVLGLPAYAR